MSKTLFALWLALLLVVPLVGQKRPRLNDGEWHGDAPYLLEEGWTPLLNGKDLTGWRGQSASDNQWLTTTGILWERLLVPTRAAMEHAEAPTNQLMLQGDHGPVAYRNIYVRPLREIIKR
jgi:hypothetical protein